MQRRNMFYYIPTYGLHYIAFEAKMSFEIRKSINITKTES